MSSTSSNSSGSDVECKETARGKANKPGKLLSMSFIWIGLAVVAIGAVIQVSSVLSNMGKAQQYDRDIVAVTSVAPGDDLQPMSVKIAGSAGAGMPEGKPIQAEDYSEVWKNLEALAPPTAPDKEREAVIVAFLSGLNYVMVERGGKIVSMTTGEAISPSALTCYLNGYIPEKPYIKTNCPSS